MSDPTALLAYQRTQRAPRCRLLTPAPPTLQLAAAPAGTVHGEEQWTILVRSRCAGTR